MAEIEFEKASKEYKRKILKDYFDYLGLKSSVKYFICEFVKDLADAADYMYNDDPDFRAFINSYNK